MLTLILQIEGERYEFQYGDLIVLRRVDKRWWTILSYSIKGQEITLQCVRDNDGMWLSRGHTVPPITLGLSSFIDYRPQLADRSKSKDPNILFKHRKLGR